jgi:hypothetical protein
MKVQTAMHKGVEWVGPEQVIVDVRYWHLADMLSDSLNVCFQGQSGHRVTL